MRLCTRSWPANCLPIVSSEFRASLCGLTMLAAGGAAIQSLSPAPGPNTAAEAWSQAGGRHPLAADWFWLQADLAWERRDPVETRQRIAQTLAAFPQSEYFWLNSARMLAYDLPAWAGSDGVSVAPPLRAHRRKEFAEEALQLLVSGSRWHPHSVALEVEMGNICLYALGDRTRAAEHYRLAAARDAAPRYAERIARRLGEPSHRDGNGAGRP
jgi:hypothetical protein